MYKQPYRNSPFGLENWTDMYMARNYMRYMDSGKRPGCGFYVFLGIALFIFFAFLYIICVPSNQISKDKTHVTSHNGLNIRNEPNSKAIIEGVVPYNEIVSIIETNGPNEIISGRAANWIKIEYKGTTGWVWGGFIYQ